MSSAKSTLKSVWSMSHYDLGEIRTEKAIRSTPPEKKERLGDKEEWTKNASETPRRRK